MSITLSQIGLMVEGTPEIGPGGREVPTAPSGSAPVGARKAVENTQPAGWQAPQLSTAIRIDDQRRIYYEVINDHTGQVVLQIPPEVVRNIGDGINQFLQSLHPARSIDVKS